jgi:hypothetical protein
VISAIPLVVVMAALGLVIVVLPGRRPACQAGMLDDPVEVAPVEPDAAALGTGVNFDTMAFAHR